MHTSMRGEELGIYIFHIFTKNCIFAHKNIHAVFPSLEKLIFISNFPEIRSLMNNIHLMWHFFFFSPEKCYNEVHQLIYHISYCLFLLQAVCTKDFSASHTRKYKEI